MNSRQERFHTTQNSNPVTELPQLFVFLSNNTTITRTKTGNKTNHPLRSSN
ncbi:hypothetical protein Hanom_Chr09g00769951 [Helianthus anomalus]